MAPAIKELSRWLDANSEYYVAPDWADVVKHSVSTTHFNFLCFLCHLAFCQSDICITFSTYNSVCVLISNSSAGFPPRREVLSDPDGTSQQRSELSAPWASASQ